MREYRKKMEEQRRLREKILQEKENRRKQAALDRQDDPRDHKTSGKIYNFTMHLKLNSFKYY